MPIFAIRLKQILTILAAGLIFAFGIYGASSLGRWRYPQATAAGFADGRFHPIEMIVPEHASRQEVEARYAEAAELSLASERTHGKLGLFLAGVGMAASTVLLIVSRRIGRTRAQSQSNFRPDRP